MKFYCLIILFLFSLLLQSCINPGCTHPGATNYNNIATSDDGSCTFVTYANVFFHEPTSRALIDDDIHTVIYFFNGDYVGSLPSSAHIDMEDENKPNSVGRYVDLGNNEVIKLLLTLKDQHGDTFYSDSLDIIWFKQSYEFNYP